MRKFLVIATAAYLVIVTIAIAVLSIGTHALKTRADTALPDWFDLWSNSADSVYVIGVLGPIVLCGITLFYWRRRRHAQFIHPLMQRANRFLNLIYLALTLVAVSLFLADQISSAPWLRMAAVVLFTPVLNDNSSPLLIFNIISLTLCRPVPGSDPYFDDLPDPAYTRVAARSRFRWNP